MTLRFTKMHGLGNDYVYVDCVSQSVADPVELAKAVADRHFGIGGDGLILILPPTAPDAGDVRMRMFNADGSESAMCGNGVRCVAKFAYDHGLARVNPIRVETGAGMRTIQLVLGDDGRVRSATVDMGEPILEPDRIPVDLDDLRLVVDMGLPTALVGAMGTSGEIGMPLIDVTQAVDVPLTTAINVPLTVDGRTFEMTCVSMGNPHAVIYVADLAAVNLAEIGPKIEHHPMFPKRVNVHFVQVHDAGRVTMATWERGSGITLACGTGASAVCVAGVLTGRSARAIDAQLPGGHLQLEWRQSDNHVYMTGPATEVFSGVWPG